MRSLRSIATNTLSRGKRFVDFFKPAPGQGVDELNQIIDTGRSVDELSGKPGWLVVKAELDRRYSDYINILLHDPTAKPEEFKLRAAEIDSILKWISATVEEGKSAQVSLEALEK